MKIRGDLIADRYDGLSVGPRILYSFDSQETIPIDGTQDLSQYSKFTLSLVPPQVISDDVGAVDINTIARASRDTKEFQTAAQAFRDSFGTGAVTGNSITVENLETIVAAGQVISGLTSTRERAVIVDQYTAADIALQVEQMLSFPPLTLLVNPNSFSIDYSQIQEYGDRTRKGYVYQKWGQEQPSISFSGTTSAFIAGNANQFSVAKKFSGTGWPAKRDSAAFQNFMALYTFYRNNGMVHDTINRTLAHHMVGAIAINYDQMTYIGHMESFDYSYTEELTSRIEWSVSFKPDIIYDNSGDPTYLGLPKSVGNNITPTTFQGNGGAADPFSENFESQYNGQLAQTPLDLLLPEGR